MGFYADLVILSNGPGEVTTWVRPVVTALREQLGDQIRISVILSPCPHATGKEAAIALSYPEVNRVQKAEDFFSFLLWGKTADNWDWCEKGVVLFLGGDQFFTVAIAKRLNYRSVVYAEWEARWLSWIDYFGVMKESIQDKISPQFQGKFTVVGDLMADISINASPQASTQEIIGLLPGSKPAKLSQGVPLCLAVAEKIHQVRPQTRFIIPVAPTLDLESLAKFANPDLNPVSRFFGEVSAQLILDPNQPYLQAPTGLKIDLYQEFPAHRILTQCQLCITTVGANTAELGALAVPMVVLLPTQQLDAMKAWDGIPGILANLPIIGSYFAKLINTLILRQKRLFAWANIWAGEMIVPELIGNLQPQAIADLILDWLTYPEKLAAIQSKLRQVRGEAGAAEKLAQIVKKALN